MKLSQASRHLDPLLLTGAQDCRTAGQQDGRTAGQRALKQAGAVGAGCQN